MRKQCLFPVNCINVQCAIKLINQYLIIIHKVNIGWLCFSVIHWMWLKYSDHKTQVSWEVNIVDGLYAVDFMYV